MMRDRVSTDNNYISVMGGENSSTFWTYLLSIAKMIIVFAFLASLLFGIFQSIRKTSLDGFIDGIMFGIIGALTVVPMLVIFDMIIKIKCFYRFKKLDFRVNQEKTLVIRKGYSNTFNDMLKILIQDKNIHVDSENKDRGTIDATVKKSWKSFGEIIKIKISKTSEDNSTVVRLSSKPRLALTMMDYSKNFENIENIINNLAKNGAPSNK